jgi:hypothetical protein
LANVKILNHSYFTINDLVRVVTLHAAVIASGSLTYLVGCGVNQYDHSTIDTRFKLQKVFFLSSEATEKEHKHEF